MLVICGLAANVIALHKIPFLARLLQQKKGPYEWDIRFLWGGGDEDSREKRPSSVLSRRIDSGRLAENSSSTLFFFVSDTRPSGWQIAYHSVLQKKCIEVFFVPRRWKPPFSVGHFPLWKNFHAVKPFMVEK